MTALTYKNNEAYLEGVALTKVAALFGTPAYVYSQQTLEANLLKFRDSLNPPDQPLRHLLCYAVKANSNLSILSLFSSLGAGFDMVSQGELERVLLAGGSPQKIVFSGVGKSESELEFALQAGIYCFNVESEDELARLESVSKRQHKVANIALRINPDIDAQTHPHISTGLKENKFGIPQQNLAGLYPRLKQMSHLKLIGLACHIGSQIVSIKPYLELATRMRELYSQAQNLGFQLEHLNLGGGLGVRYKDETPPPAEEYIGALKKVFADLPIKIVLEPGRALVADSGLLLCQVEYLKTAGDTHFAIVNAGMNDLLRPALYEAWHDILPVKLHDTPVVNYQIVGPICESADVLGVDRPLRLKAHDLLAITMAGAYGFSMCSNYNSRTRPPEILVDGDRCLLIRRRETAKDLIAFEKPYLKDRKRVKANLNCTSEPRP